jgi:hypothetical protein
LEGKCVSFEMQNFNANDKLFFCLQPSAKDLVIT